MPTRLEVLKQLVEQDPAGGFTRYGLALEYVNTGDLAQAITEFDELLRHNPNYAYGYFQRGKTLEKLGRTEEARATYRDGIEAAGRAGDAHARGEIQGALEMLGG
ncbi:MAG: tetratricopeptide repeat protein [Acidobacteria bacterium]|nr:tetratricopeptide repeat protein [Acidobacteriota bacterium]